MNYIANKVRAGLMGPAHVKKLDSIEAGAQVNPGNATPSSSGLMSATDKSKLDGIEAGAQVNAVTSVAGKTGAVTLSASDISGLGNAASRNVGTTAGTVAAGDDPRFASLSGLQIINVKSLGAVGDGVANDSPAINAALAGGNKHVYFPAGLYRCESYLRVYKNTKIELHPHAVIIHAANTSALFMNGEYGNSSYASGYNGEGNLWFTGGTIDCTPKQTLGQICEPIAIAHAENILIEHMTFSNNHQDHFIELNSVRNGIVRNCVFDNTTLSNPGSRECINIDYAFSTGFPHFGSYDNTPCEDILIIDCVFKNGDVAVGSHSTPPAKYKNIQIVNCRVDNMVSYAFDARHWDFRTSRIDRCRITGVPGSNEVRMDGLVFFNGRFHLDLSAGQAVAVPFRTNEVASAQNPQGLFLIGGYSNQDYSPRGVYWAHCAPTARVLEVASIAAENVELTTGTLTSGGSDTGKVIISAGDDGNLYVKNSRSGGFRLDIRLMAH